MKFSKKAEIPKIMKFSKKAKKIMKIPKNNEILKIMNFQKIMKFSKSKILKNNEILGFEKNLKKTIYFSLIKWKKK